VTWPNDLHASARADLSAPGNAPGVSASRTPRPPTPPVAFTITGKPSSPACRAASASAAGAPAQGTMGMPRPSASRLLAILSPRARMAAGEAPMKVTPSPSQSSANSGNSATKPQPGQAASARVCRSASSRRDRSV
jgi:hypothetical protein